MENYFGFEEAVKFPDWTTVNSHIISKYRLMPDHTNDMYHYTDIEGFKGIIEDNCLWATNINFMNDSKEYKEGMELCYHEIESLLKTNIDEKEKEYLNQLKIILGKDGAGFWFDIKNEDVFSLSFCKNGDLLSQWRGYGKGCGISIGFDISELHNINLSDKTQADEFDRKIENGELIDGQDLEKLRRTGLRAILRKVEYDNKKKQEIIKEILEIGRLSIKEGRINNDPEFSAQGVAGALKTIIPLLKDEGFREECECRFVRHFFESSKEVEPAIHFRTRNDIILPFLKLKMRDWNNRKLEQLPIKEIIVGPNKNQEYIIKSIKYFLEKEGHKYLIDKVHPSKIPYRD